MLVAARHPASGRVVMLLAQRLGRWARLHPTVNVLSAEDTQIFLDRMAGRPPIPDPHNGCKTLER